MEERKSIKRNYLYNVSYQILTLITPLITTPYISRILGANGIGTVSFIESIVSYFTLFATMGIPIYGQREISYAQDSKHRRSIVFWNAKVLQIFTTSLALILYIIFIFYNVENKMLYFIFSMNIIAVIFDITWFLQGIEEFGKTVLRNIIVKIISIIYIFGAIKTSEDIGKYAFGICFFTFVSSISLLFYLPKYIERVKLKELSPFKELPVMLSLFIPTIAIQIYTVLDKTMIGIITSDSFENGYYEQAIKISRIILRIVTSLGTVIAPRIGYYFEKKDIEGIERLMYRGYRFIWFLGVPLCIGLIIVSSNFVPWFFGEGYDEVSNLLKILAFLIIAIGISNVTGIQYLIPTKRQNILTYTVIIGAIINFVLNIFLIPLLKAKGAAIASVVAESTITIVQLVIVRKEIKPLRVLWEGKNYYIAGIAMGVFLGILRIGLESSFINTIILVISGICMYGLILLIIHDELLLDIVSVNCIKNIMKKHGV